jgi:type VI secretion system protein ImpE
LLAGAFEVAAASRDEAFEQAPAIAGSVNDQNFEWIADADPRLGPVIEAILDGTYYWVPMQHISRLKIEPPADVRDQVWLPVDFTWTNGGTSVGFIPTRYPGSATASDPMLALGKRTEWIEQDHGWALGLGQRMFATDDGDVALMDIRDLVLTPAVA